MRHKNWLAAFAGLAVFGFALGLGQFFGRGVGNGPPPATAPGLDVALQALDELVAGCGGRVYLTKDARMRADTLRAMYPLLERFEAERERVDPDGVLRSDLAVRLGLCGEAR